MPLTVLSPVPKQIVTTVGQRAQLPALSASLRVGLLSNSKPNVDHLFEGMAISLRMAKQIERIDLYKKGSPAFPAPEDLLREMAGKCDAVILAIAD